MFSSLVVLVQGVILLSAGGVDLDEVFSLDDDFRDDLADGEAGLKAQPADHPLRLRGEPDGSDALPLGRALTGGMV